MEYRDFQDPRWKAARYATYKRDEFRCSMCQKTGVPLNAHHIIKFCENESLRFNVNNLITLCIDCHRQVTGNEHAYELEFKRIVRAKLKAKGGKQKYPNSKGNRYKKPKWKPGNTNLRF